MSEVATTSEGGCRCGQVRFSVAGEPLLTAACHCTGCQRMSSSAFSLSSSYPADAFTVTQGEPVIGGTHGDNRHLFCPHCMSWMFNRPGALPDLVMVRTSMLDEPPAASPFTEFYRREGLPWAQTGAVHSFEAVPDLAGFQTLLAEFAATTARTTL